MRRPLLVLLVLGLAAGLRIFNLSLVGFWTDEFCTLSQACGWGLRLDQLPVDRVMPPLPVCTRLSQARPVSAIPAGLAADDTHPPLYFLAVRLWEMAFGDSEAAVRSLNVVCSLAAVVLLYTVARRSVGEASALTASLLMAVAVPQIQFSQEARNYMPAVTATLAAAYFVVRRGAAVRQPGPVPNESRPRTSSVIGIAGFGASLLAMMLTHYYTAAAAAAIVGYALTTSPRRKSYAVATGAAAAVFLSIWGGPLRRQFRTMETSSTWLNDAGPGRVGRLLWNLCLLPTRLVVDDVSRPAVNIVAGVIGLAVLLSVPVLFVKRPPLRFWIVWFVASVGLVAAVDAVNGSKQLFWLRYSLLASPPLYVILASAVRGRWRLVVPGIAIVVALSSLWSAYVPAWKTDYGAAVESIGHQMRPGDALIVAGPDRVMASITFAAFQHYLPVMPETAAVLTRPPSEAVVGSLRSADRVWVIWTWPDRPIAAVLPTFVIEDDAPLPGIGRVVRGSFRRN